MLHQIQWSHYIINIKSYTIIIIRVIRYCTFFNQVHGISFSTEYTCEAAFTFHHKVAYYETVWYFKMLPLFAAY